MLKAKKEAYYAFVFAGSQRTAVNDAEIQAFEEGKYGRRPNPFKDSTKEGAKKKGERYAQQYEAQHGVNCFVIVSDSLYGGK